MVHYFLMVVHVGPNLYEVLDVLKFTALSRQKKGSLLSMVLLIQHWMELDLEGL